MTELIYLFWASSCAFVPGAIGLACQLFWPLLRSRRAILLVQSGIGFGYGTQYALLHAWSGASVAWLGGGQTVLILIAGSGRLQRATSFVAFPLLAIAVAMTWSGLPSVFAAFACTLTILGRLQRDTFHLRSFQLLAAPFGIAYDISVGALPALCGGIAATAIATLAFRREVRGRTSVA